MNFSSLISSPSWNRSQICVNPSKISRRCNSSITTVPTAAVAVDKMSNVVSDTSVIDILAPVVEHISWYSPYQLAMKFQDILSFVHTTTDIPWWASIIALNVAFRVLLFPLYLKIQRNAAKMRIIQPEVTAMQAAYKAKENKTQMDSLAMQTAIMALWKKHDYRPFLPFQLMFVQMPFFMSFFFGLKNLNSRYPESATGGISWISDLSIPDPYFILPVTMGVSILASIELSSDGVNKEQLGKMLWVFRGLSVMSVIVTSTLPAAVAIYFVINQFMTLGMTQLIKLPRLRKVFGIPAVPKTAPVVSQSSILDSMSSLLTKADPAKAAINAIAPPPKPPAAFMSSRPAPKDALTQTELHKLRKQKKL